MLTDDNRFHLRQTLASARRDTDIEFYEVRYGGKSASFVRGFRIVYSGLIVNTVVMANVILAIIKILNTMLESIRDSGHLFLAVLPSSFPLSAASRR